jgi:hypothetical protein
LTFLHRVFLQAFMAHRSISSIVIYTAVADKRSRNIWQER